MCCLFICVYVCLDSLRNFAIVCNFPQKILKAPFRGFRNLQTFHKNETKKQQIKKTLDNDSFPFQNLNCKLPENHGADVSSVAYFNMFKIKGKKNLQMLKIGGSDDFTFSIVMIDPQKMDNWHILSNEWKQLSFDKCQTKLETQTKHDFGMPGVGFGIINWVLFFFLVFFLLFFF